jgi:hypothetical protein
MIDIFILLNKTLSEYVSIVLHVYSRFFINQKMIMWSESYWYRKSLLLLEEGQDEGAFMLIYAFKKDL